VAAPNVLPVVLRARVPQTSKPSCQRYVAKRREGVSHVFDFAMRSVPHLPMNTSSRCPPDTYLTTTQCSPQKLRSRTEECEACHGVLGNAPSI
jgi:hypothetical protein